MITSDPRQIKKLEHKLAQINPRGVKFANMFFVNDAAFAIMREWKSQIDEKMVLRNKWTEKSIRVQRASMRDSLSRVGSVQEYMLDQEFGSIETARGKTGVILPTSYSSGEGKNARPRQKLPRGRNKLSNIRLGRGKGNPSNRRQALVMKISDAINSGNRYFYHDMGRRKGIFRVIGGTKRRPEKSKLRMIYDLTHRSVTIPPNPTLWPSVQRVRPKMPRMYVRQLLKQINRAIK